MTLNYHYPDSYLAATEKTRQPNPSAHEQIMSIDLCRDLALRLGWPVIAAKALLVDIGICIQERLSAGKPAGIPTIGSLWVTTRKDGIRAPQMRFGEALKRSIRIASPVTEKFSDQLRVVKERRRAEKAAAKTLHG